MGKGRFPAKWGGTSPVVVLAASLRIQLELERLKDPYRALLRDPVGTGSGTGTGTGTGAGQL